MSEMSKIKRWISCHAVSMIAMLASGLVCSGSVAQVSASPPSTGIYVNWPSGWEMQPLERQGNALHLRARLPVKGQIKQQLRITAVPVNASPRPVTPETLRSTVEKLRDAVAPTAAEPTITLQPFHRLQGYYFVMTDKHPSGQPGDFPQMAEGIFLSSGYLVNVTLLMHNVNDVDSQAILNALETVVVR